MAYYCKWLAASIEFIFGPSSAYILQEIAPAGGPWYLVSSVGGSVADFFNSSARVNMEASLHPLPPPFPAPAASAETVTVSLRLLYRQRILCYSLASFTVMGVIVFGSAKYLGTNNLPWNRGSVEPIAVLLAVLFWLVPIAIAYISRHAYIKPAQFSFTAQGVWLEASDKQYQVVWADLAAYQVEFSLTALVGSGYRLKLWDTQGQSVVFNLLERELLTDTPGIRTDTGLAYLCQYIGRYNRQAQQEQIVLRPPLLSRKPGVVLLAVVGILVLVDVAFWVQNLATRNVHISVLAGAIVLVLQVLGQKKQNDRYARYLHALQEEGLGAS
jgi:hypothetical protein